MPNRDRLVFFKDGVEILPGVQAMSAPGHTVGHTIFMVTSNGQTLCVSADTAHHSLLTLSNPKVEFGFDTDPQQGAATRIRLFDMLAAQRLPVLAYHFPWPGIGHVAKEGEGYRFIPEQFQTAL
jgi:glyoxylase-like metal-dependent hydrolase (beta-lactamase superfamily II)